MRPRNYTGANDKNFPAPFPDMLLFCPCQVVKALPSTLPRCLTFFWIGGLPLSSPRQLLSAAVKTRHNDAFCLRAGRSANPFLSSHSPSVTKWVSGLRASKSSLAERGGYFSAWSFDDSIYIVLCVFGSLDLCLSLSFLDASSPGHPQIHHVFMDSPHPTTPPIKA